MKRTINLGIAGVLLWAALHGLHVLADRLAPVLLNPFHPWH